MKVAALQWDLVWEGREENLRRARELAPDGVGLIALPEMFSSGFSMNVEAVAEPEPSPSEAFLRELAEERNAAVLGGLVRKGEGGRGRNELEAWAPEGERLARYRKMRTFRYTTEPDHYESGDSLALFSWRGWKVCPFICYDLRFPELFRRATAAGAELFVVIANWPTVRVEHWLVLLRARAIENQAYVIGVNRCGTDPQLEYPGRSVIVDPRGEIVADAGAEEGVAVAEIDLEKLRAWRKEFPALEDLEA